MNSNDIQNRLIYTQKAVPRSYRDLYVFKKMFRIDSVFFEQSTLCLVSLACCNTVREFLIEIIITKLPQSVHLAPYKFVQHFYRSANHINNNKVPFLSRPMKPTNC